MYENYELCMNYELSCLFVSILGLFSGIYITVLCLYLGQCSVLLVSLHVQLHLNCLFVGRIKIDRT